MSDPINEIKNQLDIVDVVREYVKLDKVGSNYRALCPFHTENDPSFFVSPSRQMWRCFGGCNEGGDMFDFIMKIEGIEFGDALKILADKAGVELKPQDPELQTKRDNFYELYELATKFYEKQLNSSKQGKKAKKYLLDRGIKEESIEKWRLGYSPDSWQALSKFLISQGHSREDIIEAGLAIKKEEKDSSYDRFRSRIMFPIFSLSSQPIAFGGRVFGDEEETAKYINSPQTLLYDKSKILYGLDKAKTEVRREEYCILAEGYTDVIMISQAGYENVVSTSGTALTKSQLDILSRYTDNLYTAFDMDEAGSSATKKGIKLAQKMDFDVKVISLPKDKDPADLILDSQDKWEKAIEDRKTIMEFYFDSALTGKDLSDPKDKKQVAKEVLPAIKRIPNSIERSHWVKKMSEELDIDEEPIYDQLQKTEVEQKRNNSSSEEDTNQQKKKSKVAILEERVASLVAKNNELASEIDIQFLSEEIAEVIEAIENEEEEQLKEKIDYFALKPDGDVDHPQEEIEACLKEIKKLKIQKTLRQIQKKIKKAEQSDDKQSLEKLTKKADKLSKKLKSYD